MEIIGFILLIVVGTLHSMAIDELNGNCENVDLWCKSQELAKECGMVEFCKNSYWKERKSLVKNDPTLPKKSNTNKTADPVSVTLYFESLCPGCRKFILNQAYPTYMKLQKSGILKMDFVPFGNAIEKKTQSGYEYTCQHGPVECLGNKIESCARFIRFMGQESKFVQFINCFESLAPSQKMQSNAQQCAEKVEFDYYHIDHCLKSTDGIYLQHQMAMRTKALNPPQTYVPWLTLNGVHTDSIQTGLESDMLAYVCQSYTGPKPKECVA